MSERCQLFKNFGWQPYGTPIHFGVCSSDLAAALGTCRHVQMSVLTALSISRRPATAFVVVGMFWGAFAAHVPVIKAQLGVDDAMFGLLLLGSATGLVSSMWIAPLADRVLGARSMQVGIVLLALAWLVPSQISMPLAFAATMAVVGMASGLLDVVMNARVSELEASHKRPLMNANHAMFSVAYAVSALISGFTREAGISPLWVFVCLAVLAVLAVPKMQMAVAPVADDDGTTGRYPVWPIVLTGAIVFVAFMTEATVEAWSALHIERTLGGGAAEGALGPAMLGFMMAIGRFSGQAVSEKLPDVLMITCAAALSSLGAVTAALAHEPWLAYVGFGILGLGVSVIGPLGLALVGRLVPAHLRTQAISRVAVLGFSGFFLAPMLMGLVSQAFGLRVAFICVAVLISLAIPMARATLRLPKG